MPRARARGARDRERLHLVAQRVEVPVARVAPRVLGRGHAAREPARGRGVGRARTLDRDGLRRRRSRRSARASTRSARAGSRSCRSGARRCRRPPPPFRASFASRSNRSRAPRSTTRRSATRRRLLRCETATEAAAWRAGAVIAEVPAQRGAAPPARAACRGRAPARIARRGDPPPRLHARVRPRAPAALRRALAPRSTEPRAAFRPTSSARRPRRCSTST